MQIHRPETLRCGCDWTFVALLLGVVPLHVLSWATYPSDVNPVNFVLALDDYNVLQERPHAPGYPAFVMLARLIARLGAPTQAYQWLNLLLLIVAVGAVYAVLRHVGRPAIGLALASITVTHPLVWAATVISESYISDLAFSVLIVATVYFASLRGRHVLIPAVFAVFVACGLFRAVSCAMLMPLAVMTARCMNPDRWMRPVVLTFVCASAGTAVAYVTTVWLAGGILVYRAAAASVMGQAFASTSVLGGASMRQHLTSLTKFLVWFSYIALLYPTLLAGLSALTKGWRHGCPRWATSDKFILSAWIAPAFAFYALIYYLKPAYHLIYLVPVLYVAVVMADHFADHHLPRFAAVVGVIVVAQLGLFFFGDDRVLPAPLYRLTHAHVQQQDGRMAQLFSAARQLRPSTCKCGCVPRT